MDIRYNNIEDHLENLTDPTKVCLDKLNWIEPIAIALLKANHDNNSPQISSEGISLKAWNYVSVLSKGDADLQKTYIPLLPINRGNTEEIRQKIVKKVIDQFTKKLSSDNSSEEKKQLRIGDFKTYLNYIVSELLNNVIDHSCSDGAMYVTGQYFPYHNKTQIVILDSGIGYLQSLKKKYPDLKDELQAINKALQPWVTGNTNELSAYSASGRNNVGVGLYLTQKILEATNNKLKIISNNGLTSFEGASKSQCNINSAHKGVIVSFEIKENLLDQEFKELFDFLKTEMPSKEAIKNDELEDLFD